MFSLALKRATEVRQLGGLIVYSGWDRASLAED